MPKHVIVLFGASIWLAFSNTGFAKPITLESPEKKASVLLSLAKGQPQWELDYNGHKVLKSSRLGLLLGEAWQGGFEVLGAETASADSIWKPVWGRCSEVRDHYNELTWKLLEKQGAKRRLDIVVRAYDAGVAIRYRLHGEGNVQLEADETRFAFTATTRAGVPTASAPI